MSPVWSVPFAAVTVCSAVQPAGANAVAAAVLSPVTAPMRNDEAEGAASASASDVAAAAWLVSIPTTVIPRTQPGDLEDGDRHARHVVARRDVHLRRDDVERLPGTDVRQVPPDRPGHARAARRGRWPPPAVGVVRHRRERGRDRTLMPAGQDEQPATRRRRTRAEACGVGLRRRDSRSAHRTSTSTSRRGSRSTGWTRSRTR